jgi:hypothetical protein
LGNSAVLGLNGVPIGFEFGVSLVEEAGVGAGLGEICVPLELRGTEDLGAALAASQVGGLSAFGDSPPGWESSARASSSTSCGFLHKNPSQHSI